MDGIGHHAGTGGQIRREGEVGPEGQGHPVQQDQGRGPGPARSARCAPVGRSADVGALWSGRRLGVGVRSRARERGVPSRTWRATSIIRDRVPMAVFWMKPKASDSVIPDRSISTPLAPSTSRRVSSLSSALTGGPVPPSEAACRASASMAHSCSHRAMAWSMAGMSSMRWNGLTR